MDRGRLDALDSWLLDARQVAAGATLLVEGKRDRDALEALGIGGDIVLVNQGKPVQQVLDALAERPRVILLLDWDRTGHVLANRFKDGLVGRSQVDNELRKRLATLCQCVALEHVPAEIAGLRARFSPETPTR